MKPLLFIAVVALLGIMEPAPAEDKLKTSPALCEICRNAVLESTIEFCTEDGFIKFPCVRLFYFLRLDAYCTDDCFGVPSQAGSLASCD